MSRYITVNADVEVDLMNIGTKDLLDELERRKYKVKDQDAGIKPEDIERLRQSLTGNDQLKTNEICSEIIYKLTGKVV